MYVVGNKRQHRAGFTLVELSIVLVIIGLLVGGVLVGQDLIKAAELKGTISDIRNLQTAFIQFRDKYNCVPGDCAYQSKFFDVADGDGNRYIECGNAPPWCMAPINEHGVAYEVMHLAGLIRSSAATADGFEPTKLRECQLFMHSEFDDMYGAPDANFMHVTENLTASPWHQDCMTPEEAMQIDMKMDDGYAGTGALIGKSTTLTYSECADEKWDEGAKYEAEYNTANSIIACTLFLQLD